MCTGINNYLFQYHSRKVNKIITYMVNIDFYTQNILRIMKFIIILCGTGGNFARHQNASFLLSKGRY